MQRSREESKWNKKNKVTVIIIGIVLIASLFVFLYIVEMSKPSPHRGKTAPVGQIIAEYDNTTNTYRIYVNNSTDTKGMLKINEMSVFLVNDNGSSSYDLDAILDNEDSNITYYDIDNNGTLSIGDEFFIDGNIVGSNARFKVIYNTQGKAFSYVDLT
jgi:hypothetical protein